MGRRPVKNSAPTSDLKAGDVVWAPYRRFPEWPALVRCVYPKKVTYTFLPIDEGSNLKSSIFSCPPQKLRLLTGSEPLPAGTKSDMKEAYKAALEILKKSGLPGAGHQMSGAEVDIGTRHFGLKNALPVLIIVISPEELVAFKTSEINKQSVLGDLVKKTKKDSDAASSGDTASNASAPHVWGIGEVVWLSMPNHSEWPVVIRELKKKFAMVDAFPLKFNCKPERYPLSACQKFELTGKNLEATIKKERNCELRMALQSVMKYFKRREQVSNVEKSDTDDNDIAKVDVENDTQQGRDRKGRTIGGLEEELQSVDGEAEAKLAGMLKEGENKRDGKRRLDKSPSPAAKRQKFSDVMKDLETELSEKLENLNKGDLAWINRARSGRIVKWPILVLKVDNVNKSCVCTELPLDDMSANAEWCLNSEKTLVVQLKNIYLYDTVEAKVDEIEDEELKAAIQQADEIAEGSYRPFDDERNSFDKNGNSSIRENGCKAASSSVLAPKEILRLCKSEMCARHLMAIWTGQFTCTRHAGYEPPVIAPLHFELNTGDLLPETDAILLVEHLDATVAKFKDAMKSSLRRLHYVTTVAVPEAVIFAITQIRYCSGSEANEIFENALLKTVEKTPSEPSDEIGATTGFEQLLKAASKVRCAALGMD
uniref:PWWP domain-containing protein n=1 Tax=Elaeophora elaphi TaxID=1147741 RepID=A0A158Q7Z9_9BILA